MKHKNANNNKHSKKIMDESLYMYIQIIVTSVMIISCTILKFENEDIFYQLKEDYRIFFTTETVYESNFSYKNFLNVITSKAKDNYEKLTETIAFNFGKGSSSLYPNNISTKKYVPEQKGIVPVKGIVSSDFGLRVYPFDKNKKDFHTGMDIAAAKGTYIKSAFDGLVTETGYTDIAGNYIKVTSNEELQTFYGHTQFILVKTGETVYKGQPIATVGDTGLVTGPHLHFEVLYNGNRVNPVYTVE